MPNVHVPLPLFGVVIVKQIPGIDFMILPSSAKVGGHIGHHLGQPDFHYMFSK